MEVDMKKFDALFKKAFKSNYNLAGRELGISPAHVYRVINKKSTPGMDFINKLIVYCQKNSIDCNQYIKFFNHTVDCK